MHPRWLPAKNRNLPYVKVGIYPKDKQKKALFG
jgi:hypothetical protein